MDGVDTSSIRGQNDSIIINNNNSSSSSRLRDNDTAAAGPSHRPHRLHNDSTGASESRRIRRRQSPGRLHPLHRQPPQPPDSTSGLSSSSRHISSTTTTRHSATVMRKFSAVLSKKLKFFTELMTHLDMIVYAELCTLYYMECSLFRLLLRAIPQSLFLSPKADDFLLITPAHRPHVFAVFVPNTLCMLLHLVSHAPAGSESSRGYLHGGVFIDFIGQKAPSSRWVLLLLDCVVLAVQCLMLAVHTERERLRKQVLPIKGGSSSGSHSSSGARSNHPHHHHHHDRRRRSIRHRAGSSARAGSSSSPSSASVAAALAASSSSNPALAAAANALLETGRFQHQLQRHRASVGEGSRSRAGSVRQDIDAEERGVLRATGGHGAWGERTDGAIEMQQLRGGVSTSTNNENANTSGDGAGDGDDDDNDDPWRLRRPSPGQMADDELSALASGSSNISDFYVVHAIQAASRDYQGVAAQSLQTMGYATTLARLATQRAPRAPPGQQP